MNPGALLVGLAGAVLLVTYIARPFRKVSDVDDEIEAWIAARKSASGGTPPQPVDVHVDSDEPAPSVSRVAPVAVEAPKTADEPELDAGSDVMFCHQCGRRVKPHHRFCPRCGARLDEDDV